MKSPRRLRPFVSLALVCAAVLWSLDRADSADPAPRSNSFDSALERLGISGHLGPDAIQYDPAERIFQGATDSATYEFSLKAEAPILHLRRKDSDFGITLHMTGSAWGSARQKGALVVYAGQDVAAVYRPTNDGVKEDVIVRTAIALQFVTLSWKLDLPAHLEARSSSDGSIGIYGPDTFLWGAISTQDDSTAALIEKARRKAPRTHLLYRLPKPQIVDADRKVWSELACYDLREKTLNIEVSPETSKLRFPISIDPTVVLTTTADFDLGNPEGDTSTANNQLTRATSTSGRNGTWSTTTSFTTARTGHASVAYNGYVYVIGGGTYLTDVQVALIAADGTVGSWTTLSSTPLSVGRTDHAAVVYNGYLYVIGGETSSSTYTETIERSKIGSSGTLGSWSTTAPAAPFTKRTKHAAVAHNGYLYVLGGQTDTTAYTNDVLYAKFNADGTVGTWTAATGFTTARRGHTAVAHKGFLYVISGEITGPAYTATVYYAPVGSDGSVTAWYLGLTLATAVSEHTSVVYNGYLYVIGGNNGANQSIVEFAPVLGFGGIGSWTSSTGTTTPPYSLSAGRSSHSSVVTNGRLYVLGGTSGVPDVLYSTIQSLGTVGVWTTDTDVFTTARRGHTSVAYQGYLYVIGGESGGSGSPTYYNSVQSAPINPDGSIGAFVAQTSFTTARSSHASVVYNGILYVIGGATSATLNTSDIQYGALTATGGITSWSSTTTPLQNTSGTTTARRHHTAVAYRGFLYVIGGDDGAPLNTVQYMAIASGGNLSTTSWTTASSLPETRLRHASLVYGGYLYVIGGFFGDYVDTVYYAAINSSGSVGTWATTTVLSGTRAGLAAVAYNGYLYVIGGENTGGNLSDVIHAPINSAGTIGTWVATNPAFTTARNRHASVVYEGTLFVVGGWNNTADYDTVQSAPINVHGTTGSYSATTSLPGNRYGHAAVAYNGFLYLLGGYDSTTLYDTVHYAAINPDGTISGTWSATSSFATARYRHAAVAYNGYLYVLGGESVGGGGGYLSDVQVASIGSTGTVGTWAATTSFTTGRGRFAAVAYRGFLYVIAGNSGASLSDVQVASINSNGTVGTFGTTTALPSTRYGVAAVAYNGYLYVTGGFTGSYASDVLYSAIGATGLLGAWSSTGTFQRGRWGHTSAASHGFLYVIGGYEGNTAQPDVQYAPIQSNGAVGSWNYSRSLSIAVRSHASVAYEGRLFVLGGLNTSNSAVSTVVSAPLVTPLQSGAYSRLVDLGSDQTVNSILLNGLANLGTVRLQYRLAPSSTAAFGAENSSAVTLGSSISVAASARYVWLRLFLDDGAAAAINPDATNARDVTDVTMDYGSGSGSGSGSSDDDGGKCLGSIGGAPFSGYLLWLAGILALLPLLRRRA